MEATTERIERLKQAIEALGITQKQLAANANVTEKTIGHLLKQKHKKLTPSVIQALQERYDISREWLLHGTGAMSKSPILAAIARLLIEYSPEQLSPSELKTASSRILNVVLDPKGVLYNKIS